MDSFSQVESALTAFMADPEPGVIAIKGDWGIGKTYLWSRFIKKQKAITGYTGYSYASLFGASSLAEIRQALFVSQVSIDSIGRDLNIMARKGSVALAKLAKTIGSQDTEHLEDVFRDKALRGIVVCLDDLERKEDALTPSALLGFITNLRDERRCKVVLLYNESKTNENKVFSTVIAEYREKVIDHEVLLKPSVAECYKIIFGDRKFDKIGAARSVSMANRGDERSLLQIFDAAGIANIRLLRKSRSVLEYLAPCVATKYPNQWPVIARQAVKLCCLHFKHAQHFQLEEVAEQTKWIRLFLDKAKTGPAFDRNRKIFEEVDKIGYSPDKTDQMVVDFIRTGFVDCDAYKPLLDQLELEFAARRLHAEGRMVWDKLWNNFSLSSAEVVSAQRAFLWKHKGALGLSQVASIVIFLREHGPDSADEKILTDSIESFAKECANRPNDRDLMGLDKSVAKRVRVLFKKNRATKSIADVMTMMTREGGWTPSDAEYLCKTTQADFLAWLKTETRSDFLTELSEFRSRLSGDEAGQLVLKKLDGALRQLAKRSGVDRKRVYVGLKLEPKKRRSVVVGDSAVR